jgi:superfamily II DNA helicase RecQ
MEINYSDNLKTVDHALVKVGISSLRLKDEQLSAIYCIFNGEDVFLWLPTGFGESA